MDDAPGDKRCSMADAVAALVPDGSAVACGLALEAAIPFAFTHELIRQRRTGLTLIGPIADAVFDQLIGAGCVDEVEAAWVGNVTTGSGYCFRRAVEQGRPRPLLVRQHSNLTILVALQAAATGVPYLPTRTALGSDIATDHDGFAEVACPFTGARLLAVRAVRPDVAVVHVQRADAHGNAQAWGNLGVSVEAIGAARTVIVVAEEIVPTAVVRAEPDRTLVPGALVAAVVEEPGGTHPAPLPGVREHDPAAYTAYAEASATEDGFARWLDTHVLAVADRRAYRARFADA
ncbi:MAG: CoA transferase subunit A [Euzebyaceae bacterium]|jgi:glutaconate CoA-transferase subunit A|nr:CoA transferase subunit A [Euzebyaceae bacterium]